MKRFFFSLLLAMISVPARAEIGNPVPNCPMKALAYMHEITFTRYLEQFQRDARKYNVGCYRTYLMYFGEGLADDVAGYCVPGDRIVINKKLWNTLSSMEKWFLIYHELGHCALNLDHLAPKDIAIMNPQLLPDDISRPHWEDMKKKLFRAAQQEQRNK